ncbi:hypothetical protein BDP27DRAFT_1436016 [Rhodocollybia butyracea]|uniref:F-box domain-containing protein n=1 Tax=Rhodocollybia butyracea TaxID=206335 RepID=A0A9P5TX55_9AGAR|nr:hypothetical protein BDP27DRAFT_1436016 [Rhodocollybia butyracea]
MSTREITAARSEVNNYSSPICGLPSEILGSIFLSLKDINQPWVYRESETKKKKHLGFIQVTFVCRCFRETAIATPRLWSNIAFELGPEWMITMMERAMVAPIFLPQRFHLQELMLSGPEDEVADLSPCLIEPALMHDARVSQSQSSDS